MSEEEKSIETKQTFFLKESPAKWVAIALTFIVMLVAAIQYSETKPSREEVKSMLKEANDHNMDILNLKLDGIKTNIDRIEKALNGN